MTFRALLNFYDNNMDTYLSIIQYQSEADQVMLVKNSSSIFYYDENPVTGVNSMVAVLDPKQLAVLLSKGYIVQPIQKNPKISEFQLLKHEKTDPSQFSSAGNLYQLSDNMSLIQITNVKAYQKVLNESSAQVIPLADIHKELAEKNQVDLNEDASQIQSPPNIPYSSIRKQETLYFLIAAIVFVVVIATAAIVYFRTHRSNKIS